MRYLLAAALLCGCSSAMVVDPQSRGVVDFEVCLEGDTGCRCEAGQTVLWYADGDWDCLTPYVDEGFVSGS